MRRGPACSGRMGCPSAPIPRAARPRAVAAASASTASCGERRTPPGSPGERFKLNVYILDRQLRADGLRVAAFRQIRDPSGQWIDAPVNEQTSTALEDTILTRARELRVISTAAAQ